MGARAWRLGTWAVILGSASSVAAAASGCSSSSPASATVTTDAAAASSSGSSSEGGFDAEPVDGSSFDSAGGHDGSSPDSAADQDASSSDSAADQVCASACSALITCGVDYVQASCVSGCLTSTVFLPCLMTVGTTDCNAMALCAWKQDSASVCDGGAIPSGVETCDEVATCEGDCDSINAPPSCGCQCQVQLDPAKSLNLLINDQCAGGKCPSECGPTGNGPSCLACYNELCQTEQAQCVAN